MQKLLQLLSTKKTGNLLALLLIPAFALLAVFRLYPFENDIEKILTGPDDWSRYARLALDIKENGLLISKVSGEYFSPNGFLYNYFVAGCFKVFGMNVIPIYIIQNILLACSVCLVYFTFRNKMKPLTGLLFLFALALFGLLDVSKYYAFRLLSENLAIFTISAFFFCFVRGLEKGKLSLQLAAAFFMGLSVLTRPNLLPFLLILIVIIFFHYIKQKKAGITKLLLFLAVLVFSSSFLALRNYLVCGSFTFLPSEGLSFGTSFFKQPDLSVSLIFKKIIFFFGILSPLEPEYQIRPHWFIMWLGYFVYLFLRIREKLKFQTWEITVHAFIFSYFGLLLLIAEVGSYGFRYIVPATFIVLPFLFLAIDKLKQKTQSKVSGLN
ncbi:MAG: glycosyltransferase family 39 protein [Bacteroidia bacterium]|nr:glycosyltransferase family 39 protein [Bacteroidia bacterium]